jgi:hypothetical protein
VDWLVGVVLRIGVLVLRSTGTKVVRTVDEGRAESPLVPLLLLTPAGERPRALGVGGAEACWLASNLASRLLTPPEPELERSLLVMAAYPVSV